MIAYISAEKGQLEKPLESENDGRKISAFLFCFRENDYLCKKNKRTCQRLYTPAPYSALYIAGDSVCRWALT